MTKIQLYCEICKKYYALAESGAETRFKEWKHERGKRHQKNKVKT